MNYSLKELEDLDLHWNIECLDCRHHTDIDVKRLIGRFGENTRADDLKRNCTANPITARWLSSTSGNHQAPSFVNTLHLSSENSERHLWENGNNSRNHGIRNSIHHGQHPEHGELALIMLGEGGAIMITSRVKFLAVA